MKYTVWFMRETNGTPLKVASKGIKETDLNVSYRQGKLPEDNKTYPINLKNGVQISKNEIVILINLDKEVQYTLNETAQLMKASDLDLILTQKVIAQIMAKIRNATEPFDKSKLGMFIVVGLLGLVGGIMVGIFVYPMIMPPTTVIQQIVPTPTPIPILPTPFSYP